MLSFLLGLVKNPLTQFVASKTIGAIQHSIEMDKLVRMQEIQATKEVQIQQVVSSEKSFKDEWLTIFTSIGLTACFIPKLQPFMIKGFEIIKAAPTELLYAVLIVYGGSFGMNVMDKFRK